MQQRATAPWWRPLVLFASVSAAIAVATDTVPGGLLDGVSPLLLWAAILLIPVLVFAMPAGGSDLDRWRRAQGGSMRTADPSDPQPLRRPGVQTRAGPSRLMAPERAAELQRLLGTLSAIERQRSLVEPEVSLISGIVNLESLLATEAARLRSRLQAVEQQVAEAMSEPAPAADADR